MTAKNTEQKFWSYVDKTNLHGCWLWIGYKHKQGYGRFKWRGQMRLAHRLSLEFTEGPVDAELDVLHTCDNTSCVNPSHLRLGTHQDNMRDMMNKRRNAFGTRMGSAKFNDDQIREIRSKYSTGKYTTRELARLYGTDHGNISRIITGKLWKHVKEAA